MEYPTREWLDFLADQIEALLAAHKLEALVTGVQVSPRWVRFSLQLGLGTKISSVQNLAEELALVVEAPSVRVTRSAGSLAVEVPLPTPQPVYLLALAEELPMLPPVTGILGLSLEGEPFTLPLMAPEVTHVLIAGATGCGKTELMRSLILSLALYNRQAHLQLVLIDPKRRGFTPLDGLQHLLAPIATATEEARDLLEHVVDEMERRDRENAPATPRIVVAVDEVGDLLATGGKEIEALLVRLAQRGREAGFHILCSTQRPSADAVPSAIKANLPARLVGKVASAQEALTATGVSATDAELLRGSGDFLAVIGGQITRFQAAYTGALDIRHIMEQLNAEGYGGYVAAPEAGADEEVYVSYEEPPDADWPSEQD
jgi:S-DNA-T family DNA segregation ATPase FtsK/SpoIIIE